MDGSGGARRSVAPYTGTRRAALAGTVVALTLAGHSSAHGTLPSTAGLVLAVVIAAGLTFIAAARQRSVAWLFVFLLGSQLLLHALLVVSSGASHMTYGPMPLIPTGWMAVAHIVVTILAALALKHGDATLRAWAALLSTVLGLPPLAVGPVREQGITAVAPLTRWWVKTSEILSDASRRGPPAFVRV